MKKCTWVIFIIVLLMVVFLLGLKTKETFEKSQKKCLLLSCCVNVRDEKDRRIKWYTDAINKYLETTKLQIRAIESSGYEFPIKHERFKQYTFTSTLDKSVNFPTRGEAESILKADESGILDGFDMIVKITGKYYVPELEEEISKIPDDCGIVYQNGKDEVSNWSEVFGFRKEYINEIFGKMVNLGPEIWFEKFILDIHEKLNCNSYRFPKTMKVECVTECPHKTDKNLFVKEI